VTFRLRWALRPRSIDGADPQGSCVIRDKDLEYYFIDGNNNKTECALNDSHFHSKYLEMNSRKSDRDPEALAAEKLR
jgi:hypothetical protein